MNVEQAYHVLYVVVLLVFIVLIGLTMVRAIRGPRITDRIMSVNVIGTLVISSIAVLTLLLGEDYLLDVALIYAMISFISVLMLAAVYIPRDARDRSRKKVSPRKKETLHKENAGLEAEDYDNRLW